MKKLLVMFVIALLAIGALAGVVSAARIPGAEGGQWERAYNLDGTTATNAIVFRLDNALEDGETGTWISECNITPRTFTVNARAFVAQWARFEMTYRGWEWYVKKPGTFYADCIEGKIKSNGAIGLAFSGFGNLVRADNPQGTDAVIELWFGFDKGTTTVHDQIAWVAADQLNTFQKVYLPDDLEMHGGHAWKLWNKIHVEYCNSPGIYEMVPGTITFNLLNQVAWIDQTTGDFDPAYFTPANNYRGYTSPTGN